MSRKDEIKRKLDEGYTAVLVFEDHQYYLGISYSQFVRYVNKFIRGKRTVSKAKKITGEKETHGAAETKPREGAINFWKPWDIHSEDFF